MYLLLSVPSERKCLLRVKSSLSSLFFFNILNKEVSVHTEVLGNSASCGLGHHLKMAYPAPIKCSQLVTLTLTRSFPVKGGRWGKHLAFHNCQLWLHLGLLWGIDFTCPSSVNLLIIFLSLLSFLPHSLQPGPDSWSDLDYMSHWFHSAIY